MEASDQKKKLLAVCLIALLGAPLAIFSMASYIKNVMPPKEPSYKMPSQFEQAFNDLMGEYGMSIDLDSANYGYGKGYVEKTVPVQCEDGSEITCRLWATGAKKKSLIMQLEFEQPYDGTIPENYEHLFELLMRVFETPLYVDRSEDFFFGTYDDVRDAYFDFVNSDLPQSEILVSSNFGNTERLILERNQEEPGKPGTLLLRFKILKIKGE